MVTSTAQAPAERFSSSRVHSLTRPNLVSVGTIVWLSSELMFFAGLFAMYFTVRANNLNVWPGAPALDKQPAYHVHLTVGYATVFTIILVASSVTCQWGVFAAERGDVYGLRRWFFLTFVMGLIFVLGQANEYRNQVMEYRHLVNGVHEAGMTLSSSGYGSV